jgi:hypothetical protein
MPFALFSLSPIEIIILGLLFMGVIAVPLVIILVTTLTRKPPPEPPDYPESNREADFQRQRAEALEAENRRLQEENARLKQGPPPNDGITP